MVVTGSSAVSLDNPVFKAFVTHAVIVLVKTLVMSLLTTVVRFRELAFANPEDTAGRRDKDGGQLKPVLNNPHVERVRRCHLNDLENVLPFVLIGLLYVTTSPSLASALLHFRLFTCSRLLHTVVYLMPVPQPARALTFCLGLLATLSMALSAAAACGWAV
ncbi:microsomal glutathione S-transferase 1-like [Babylonia areolata]|uniref:microsomal glutathione S-transferase 1-like n=1 Tax=Babylonia areolata TaxID=304850 RepID=UPI003FD01B03